VTYTCSALPWALNVGAAEVAADALAAMIVADASTATTEIRLTWIRRRISHPLSTVRQSCIVPASMRRFTD
jgi:hypothetical protein